MILFWLIAAAMSALVLALIIPAMLKTPNTSRADQHAQNVEIARQRLRELDQAREVGTISEVDYLASREELEQALALDITRLEESRKHGGEQETTSRLTPAAMILPIAIAFMLPLVAGGIYLMVGEPAGIVGVETRATAQNSNPAANQASIEMMLDQLRERLAENPDDARGWSILARSSMQMQRYDDAAIAFARLNELTPGDAEVLVQYADALAMQAGGVLAGRPTELLEQALRVDPNQPQGLWLAGMAAQHRGDFEPAMTRYSRLLPLLDEDPESRSQLLNMMRNLVREAESAGVTLVMPETASSVSPTSGGGSMQQTSPTDSAALDSGTLGDAALTVRVSLSEEIAASASPSDTVFVFARATDGPPMPLAAARMQVSDLPFEVVLDDSQAMVPSMRLSSFERVDVVARISKSGQATAASGDLEGQMENVATDEDEPLQLVISRRLP